MIGRTRNNIVCTLFFFHEPHQNDFLEYQSYCLGYQKHEYFYPQRKHRFAQIDMWSNDMIILKDHLRASVKICRKSFSFVFLVLQTAILVLQTAILVWFVEEKSHFYPIFPSHWPLKSHFYPLFPVVWS